MREDIDAVSKKQGKTRICEWVQDAVLRSNEISQKTGALVVRYSQKKE